MSRHPREQLSAWHDGELPPGEAAEIERHLQGCTECSRELAIMNMLGGAMRTMTTERGAAAYGTACTGASRDRPAGCCCSPALAIWAGLGVVAWWRAELTAEWIAATGVAAGLILLLVSLGYEQYREWKETRYKDVQR
jgi:anti-sigma factor RsiW